MFTLGRRAYLNTFPGNGDGEKIGGMDLHSFKKEKRMTTPMTMIPLSTITGNPAPKPAPAPTPTAAAPIETSERAAWRRAFQRHGAAAIPLLSAGYTADEVDALASLPAVLRDRFASARIDAFNLTQLADVLGVSTNRLLSLNRQGALPVPDSAGPCPRWTRGTVIAWAAGGCRWGGVGEPQPELLGARLSAL